MELSGLNHQSQSFILLMNEKMPKFVGILTFMSRINSKECFNIYEQDKFHAQWS